MRDSLHTRLVVWYALVLTLVVALFGGAVVYQSWRSTTAGVDAELRRHAREIADALRPVEGGRFDLELPPDAADYYYIITSPTGEIVDQSDPDVTARRGEGALPARREVSVRAASGATVLVGRDITDLIEERWAIGANVLLAGLVTLGIAILGGWFVAGRALAPIARISQTARAMSAGDLQARIAIDRTESELEQVASTLNDAFDHLQRAVEQERRFTADASHELRTPISVLRAEADWALDRERTPQQYRDALTVCRRAALRMQAAIERMLALVRAESGGEMRDVAPVDIGSVIAGVVEWLAPVAQQRRVRLAVRGTTFTVSGDVEQLREAFTNVVANAILYNKPDGNVAVSIRAGATAGCIEIVDTGIGIPKDAVPKVFDRFFRVDGARSRAEYRGSAPPSGAGDGSGLGLSIARAIIVAHNGEITCTSEAGTGSVFVISLPVFSITDQADERLQTSGAHVNSTRPAAGSRERDSRRA